MPNLEEVLTIFARHVNWQDQGAKETVADFLGRNPDAHDTFGLPTDENKAIRDDRQDTEDVANDDDSKNDNKTPAPKTPAKPGPLK